MGDVRVLVMPDASGVHRILEKGDVLRDADGDLAIALTHVLTTGDDAEGQDIRNVGQLTFNAGDTVYLSEDSNKIVVTAPSGLDAPVINVPTTCAIQVASTSKLTIAAGSVTSAVPILLPSGSAGAPGLSFTGDTNTGFYRSAAETMVFVTNGAARITLGTVAMVAAVPIYAADGAAGTPSYTFSSDTNTGIFRSSNDTIGFTAGGTIRAAVTTAGVLTSDGAVGAPSYSFMTDTDTGLYLSGANTMVLVTSGTARLTLGTAAIVATLPHQAAAGAAGAPAYSFSGDPNTGVYSAGADQLGFSTGGTVRTTLTTSALQMAVPITTAAGALTVNGAATVVIQNASVTVVTVAAASVTFAQPILAASGAVGAPSMSFSGDPDTGLYSVGANQLGISAGGTLTAQVDSLGFKVISGGYTGPTTAVTVTPHNATDAQSTLLVNAGTGPITVNLPAASGRAGRIYCIKKTDASANGVTIDGNASETIDGAATYSLPTQYDGVIIQCDGSNWHVLATV